MKAAIYTHYGAPSVFHVKDVARPTPKNNEVLVKIHASTVTSGVIWVRRGQFPGSTIFTVLARLMFGITKPRNPITGFEFSGVVEDVGANVTRFRKGDPVYGTTTGLKNGAFAEYVCVPERWKLGVIASKPKELTFEEAAALPVGSMTALNLLKRITIKKDHNVLVYGASGSVGTYAVQLAKYFGCTVTAACSGKNAELVRSIGAEKIIDYTSTDIMQYANTFDVVFDAVNKVPSAQLKSLLKKGGQFVSVQSPTSEKIEHLDFLQKIIEEGKLKPVIDKTYPLERIVEANEYVDLGHKTGNVVITIGNATLANPTIANSTQHA